jgi:hypothetical protein
VFTEQLRPRVQKAAAGCDAIAKHGQAAATSNGTMLDMRLALPRGLRDCGCSGVDLDEVIGVYHALDLMKTDLASAPITANSTRRPVPPLACDHLQPIVTRQLDDWESRPPAELAAFVAEMRVAVADCVARYGLERSDIFDLTISTPLAGIEELAVRLEPLGNKPDSYRLKDCMSKSIQLDTPASGSTTLRWYIPATPARSAE